MGAPARSGHPVREGGIPGVGCRLRRLPGRPGGALQSRRRRNVDLAQQSPVRCPATYPARKSGISARGGGASRSVVVTTRAPASPAASRSTAAPASRAAPACWSRTRSRPRRRPAGARRRPPAPPAPRTERASTGTIAAPHRPFPVIVPSLGIRASVTAHPDVDVRVRLHRCPSSSAHPPSRPGVCERFAG